MEQTPRVGSEEFTELFMSVLHKHWLDILQVLKRQSPRIAALLSLSLPAGMRRTRKGWQIQVALGRSSPFEKLRQPRDNEIVAQAIHSWARSVAQLDLPQVTVNFER